MLTVLLGLILGTIALLALPFDITMRLSKGDRPRLRLSIAWAFGLLSRELHKPTGKPATGGPETKQSRRRQGRQYKGKAKAAMAFIRSPGMSARLLRLGRNIWRQLHIRRLYLHLTFGLDDPAATGQLYGALVPVLTLADRLSGFDLRICPDFTQPVLLADGCGQIRVIPLTLIGIMIAFLLSPTCLRGFTAAAKANRS